MERKRNDVTLSKKRNAMDDPFPVRLEGAPKMRPCGVTFLNKRKAIACERRFVGTPLGSSELIDITWLGY